tara:strand:- start:1907 stop:2578 length:672 start_codon:yes stop_codon:yes gene_type:complete
MKKILLITHHEFGDPGIISKILHKNYLLTTINFKNLKRLNLDDIQKYSAFILFGGKMSANSLSKETKVEYSFLSKLVKLNKTIIGICLGAQMIAKYFGSKIRKSKTKEVEIGYRNLISYNKIFFKGVKKLLQFHYEGIDYNKNMLTLAKGRIFEVDAFKIKSRKIYGFQFHPEVTAHMIQNWYSNLSKKNKGTDNLEKILKDHKKYKDINYKWMSKALKLILK